ncbi:MAG: lamin tail domain-containing protein, partial [Bacteroidales bacterium]
YDVIKVNTEDWRYRIEATDGNLDLWRQIYDMTNQGFESMENYYRLQGMDKYGKTNKYLNKLVDIDNLIDYMITIFYTGNFDAPTSSFGDNNGCNNFYAINERDNPITGFIFFNHDAEHSLFYQPSSPGIGINEDRVNLATRTDNMRMTIGGFDSFHPQWLHYKLTSNPEYRMRFNDRAWKYLKEGGLLTNPESQSRMRERAEEIYNAIVVESARWGDAKQSYSYTRDDHWLPEVEEIRTLFFKFRPKIFENQLVEGELYSTVRAPVYEMDNNLVTKDYITISSPVNIRITNTATSGTIYYTIDGKDPRLPGGDLARYAQVADSNVEMEVSKTTVIRARIRSNEGWSALSELYLFAEVEDYSGLKVTELHYYPLDSIAGTDTTSGKDFEFIELKNTGSTSINLSGLRIDSAVTYSFPDNEVLLPNEFYVIASKPVKFHNRYGLVPSGNYKGNLANEGEVILIEDSEGNRILYFGYANGYSWPIEAGGSGNSLVPVKTNPDIFPGLPEYWRNSAKIGGSPFANDGNSEINNIQEEFARSLNLYPNPAKNYITIEISEAYPAAELNVDFYDFTGKKVMSRILYNGESINLSGNGLSPGIYILDISHDGFRERVKLIYAGE